MQTRNEWRATTDSDVQICETGWAKMDFKDEQMIKLGTTQMGANRVGDKYFGQSDKIKRM